MANLVYREESFKIIGACFEVYNQKGFGFTEPVYQECLQIEFSLQGIAFIAQPELRQSYKGNPLNQFFKRDFICFGKIVVEIKSVASITDAHRSQALNYLNATSFELALLINFGQHPKLAYERIANIKGYEQTNSILQEIGSWTKDQK